MRHFKIALAVIVMLMASAVAQQPTRPIQVGMTLAKAKAAAARIDVLLAEGLRQQNLLPMPLIKDATFLRRSYLTLSGRIPDQAEAEAFFDSKATDKRALLIDQLLDSKGHTSTTVNWWFDLLRVKSRQRQISGEPFAHWLREAVRTDLAYDQFVRQMLTATGPAHAEGAGATGFLLRDANMPHDAMANTLRLFLGTRLECAQCHNHPFDHWTQKEFFEMAAFFGGIKYRAELNREFMTTMRTAANTGDDRAKQAARNLIQSLTAGISGTGSGIERLPDDYKYEDAKPKQQVFATTLFGAKVNLPRAKSEPVVRSRMRQREEAAPQPENQSREALAKWLTTAQNQRFITVITNRIWQRTFGRGLIDPVDDLKDDTKAVHPKLQSYLESLLIDLKFDLRQFERVLCLSQLFQRECPTTDPTPDQAYAFAGPVLRRMSAEQLWDSLLTLVYEDLDQRIRDTDARARDSYERFAKALVATPEELQALLQRSRRPATPAATVASLPQDSEQRQQARTLLRQFTLAQKQNNAAEVARLTSALRELGLPVPGERAARGREGDLIRASDLVQPAPQGHLLRQFGQSDRETIDGANREANVPQALTLLNGFLDQRVLSGASSLRQKLASAQTTTNRIRTAYLSTLSREPRSDEQSRWQTTVDRDGDNGLRDLVWVLCNSNEFRFIP
ncbi:MAG: DUF1549 domain-containing protein [Planctomycetota bacterium]|nr:DUF1549 domain-containing protein [Planctomycetota bacterium]